MSSQANKPHQAWGVLNPGGVRAADARVRFDGDKPVGVDRLGLALGPRESYEVSSGGGGVEKLRVVYVPLLVM